MHQVPEQNGSLQRLRTSVALATYNGAKHLQEQLDSLVEQTELPFELVVTDDGSQDETPDLIRDFAKTAPFPVHLHRNVERLGYANNFFQAASLCEGDLIAFCDQDDRWLPHKLQTCSEYFTDPEVTLVVHSAETWDGRNRLDRRFPFYEETQVTSPGVTDPFALTPGFAMVFRRRVLSLADFRNRPGCLFGLSNGSVMAHDSWVWLVGTTTGKVAKLKDVLALYRQHASNTVGAPRRQGIWRALDLARREVDYMTLAEFETRCVELLESIPDDLAPAYIGQRRDMIEQWRRRAMLHQARASVYSRSANFSERARGFASMLAMGAYSPTESKNRIGPRAALKDLSYGVSGLYKRLT